METIKVLKPATLVTGVSLLISLITTVSVFCAVGPEAYVNRTYGFVINPPSGWTIDESGASGSVVRFIGPIEEGFAINVNIMAGTTNLTLDQFVSAGKSQLPSSLTDYHLVSEGNLNIGGLDGYELVVTWTYAPAGNTSNTHTANLKNKQVIFVEKGKAYVITFTALTTNYNNYLPAFEESLQTFRLLGPESPWQNVLNIIIGAIVGASVGAIISVALFIRRRRVKAQQKRKALEMLEVLSLHGSIRIDDLAKRFAKKEADVELAVIQLKKDGMPVSFNRETREVIYEKRNGGGK